MLKRYSYESSSACVNNESSSTTSGLSIEKGLKNVKRKNQLLNLRFSQ